MLHHQRNILATAGARGEELGGSDEYSTHNESSTGRRLIEAVLDGGARACGQPIGAIEPGKRADLVVLDTRHPLLVARQGDEILDSWIFSGNSNAVCDVFVAGRHVVCQGVHPEREKIRSRFEQTLERLRR